MIAKILVFTATYNEADNVKDLVHEISINLPAADILICDDDSPDGTSEKVIELQKNLPNLHLIRRPRKIGLGTAHKLAMKYAVTNNYDQLITMDADFSHSPSSLGSICSKLSTNDFVIGSRYIEGGECNYGLVRLTLSRVANIITRSLLGIRLKETTTSFRGFRKSLLQDLEVDKIKAEGYSFFFESLYQVSQVTDKLCEIPIIFEDRRFGTSKISKSEIVRAMANLLGLFVRQAFGRKKAVAKKVEILENQMDCPNCLQPFNVEIYPEKSSITRNNVYCCTSNHHSSHGRIVQCLTCALTYTNPQPPPKTILEKYSDVEDRQYLENISARVKTFDYNFSKVIKYLPSAGRLLDVGSYCGMFLSVAKDKGYKVTGIEPSKWASKYANETMGIETFTGTIQDLPEETAVFDIVTSWDVLEHFTDPLSELRKMNEKLKQGGILAFSTLNIKNWFPRVMKENWPWFMDMHLYYFEEEVINDMLGKSGFKLLLVDKYCHFITLDYFLVKLSSLGIPGMGFVQRLIPNKILRELTIPFSFGDIQLFVCQKI